MKSCSTSPRVWIVLTSLIATSWLLAESESAATPRRSPREGGAYGLGSIWFDREPQAPQPTTSPATSSSKVPVADIEPDSETAFDLSWNLSSIALYESHPARHAGDRPDWHWDSELAPEVGWSPTDDFSISVSTGLRFARFASGPDLNSDETFASLQATWHINAQWLTTLRHESFWDFTPGFDQKVFAAHTTDARLQYDTTDPANPSPVRWQSYLEAAHSFAEPSQHDWFGFATGTGCAIRLVPQRLRLQIGAGVSYQIYPNYPIDTDHLRNGWNLHTTTALIWTPGDHIKVSLGLDYMHSAENDDEFRFDNLSMPLSVTWSW